MLERHRLLGDDGMLAADVELVSIGDHFDFGVGDPSAVGAEGLALLAWLAAHPPEQIVILAGNHDLSRVMELGLESDASFAAARSLAAAIRVRADAADDAADLKARFAAEFPGIPTPELAHRDYMSFSEPQRALVQALLVSGRMALAHVARIASNEPVLLTHAGVTTRELEILGLVATAGAAAIAGALNAFLERAVERCRDRWARGERARLELEPLHVGGKAGREGGGLLYHRPADPARRGADRAWEFDPGAPRRFDPRTLPPGIVQACGHSAHKKNRRELAGWVVAAAEHDEGCLRTLSVHGDRVVYEARLEPPRAGHATLYLIDAEMNATEPERYELLPLIARART